ncbi:MAG: ABC transporter permease [Phycisphaeraceae bacterium]|nr:ABC transporter permease [Phycisphaeraceae bacterium]
MTFLLEIIRLGLNNLRLHKLRSLLTSLGIILGVAAVIIMVSIGEGTKQKALRDIQALGATNVIIRSVLPPESASAAQQDRGMTVAYGVTRGDLRRITHFFPDARFIVPLKAVGDEISYREKRVTSQAFGSTPELIRVASLRVARGRYLTDEDMEQRSSIAVIGHLLAQQFFPVEDPLGRDIRIGTKVYRIVGVFAPVGLAGGRGSALVGRDLNLDVHIPLTTAEMEFGDRIFRRQAGSFSGEDIEISEIYLTTETTEEVLIAADRTRRLMQVEHPQLADVQIVVPWELLEEQKRTQLIWNIVLISIAAISLLIGGIGIMNIMLASVTERTREIGIRRALGATRRHIVLQFLVETGTLSCLGGVVGIVLGVGVAVGLEEGLPRLLRLQVLARYVNAAVELETQVTAWSIAASFIVAVSVGLLFGIYPAVLASRKDPIVALRYD